MQEVKDYGIEIEQTIDMIKLRIRGESQSKFVQNYVNTVKEGENIMNKNLKIDSYFENMVL